MGSGKTSWAIEYMNQADKDVRFIYITPFLEEVDRVKNAVSSRSFYDPKSWKGGKLESLKELIMNDKDIVSTHALFQRADKEVEDLLKASNYVLILDEVMNVVDEYQLNKDDFKLLLDNGMVFIEEGTGYVKWNHNSIYQETKYGEVKMLADTEKLVYFEDTILFWTFPVSIFKAFKETYILTYLFNAQEQRYYYDMNGLYYDYKSVYKDEYGRFLLGEKCDDREAKENLRGLINIYEGNLNEIGADRNSLSHSWYLYTSRLLLQKLKKNLYTYFRNNAKTSSRLNMWTTFKDYQKDLKGKGYAGTKNNPSFVPHNARATNDYRQKESLAYTVNRFMRPHKAKFYKSKGVEIAVDQWALSELLQWIWRSRIREGQPINLYIPSSRMRELLKKYLSSQI